MKSSRRGLKTRTIVRTSGLKYWINSLTVSVEKLAQSIELMVSEQKQQGKRLETLESRDGDMWRTAVKYVLTTALGLVLGAAAMKFGLK